jgi:phthiodiolone/phenolphthiodiolone dimycocerosates ketoreductase
VELNPDVLRLQTYGLHWPLPPGLKAGGSAFSVGDGAGQGQPFQDSVGSVVHAEASGFDGVVMADATDWYCPGSVWNGELSDLLIDAPDPHAVFTSEPIIAAAGAVTERIEFLWGPVDCVRRAPINIAQMVLTLDHATKGRASVILAQGQIDHMRQTGISRVGTKDKMWDAVQIVRKLIRDTEPFSFRGRVWKFDRGALATTYYGERPPDVFVAGNGEETLELAGRYADGWIGGGGDPERFGETMRTIRRHAESAGRDPKEIRIQLWTGGFMMDDEDLLEEALDHPLTKWNSLIALPADVCARMGIAHPYGGTYNYYKDIIPEWFSKTEFYEVTSRIPREIPTMSGAYGSAEKVMQHLEPFLEHGVTDVMIYNTAGMAGSKFMASCNIANQKLQAALAGRTIKYPAEVR